MKLDADRLRRLREARAWSQEQLAEVAGVNVRTVQRVEAGGNASPDTRMALSAALDLRPEALMLPQPAQADLDPPPATRPQPPKPAPRRDADAHYRTWLLFLLGTLVVVLILGLGYQFGRDLARKHNRADCIEAGRTDC